MKTLTFKAELDDVGVRVDRYLAEALDGVSRSRIQQWIEQGLLTSGIGQKIKKNHVLSEGEAITLQIPEAKKLAVVAQNIALDIVYQDSDLVVVNKPAGMVVHPAPGNNSGTLVNALLYHVKDLSDIGGVIRPGIVHRIDKDTSGLLMVAKNNLAHQSLAAQLKVHSVERKYLAVVRGGFKKPRGTVDQPLGRSRHNRLKMAIEPNGGRRAVTHYRLIEQFGEISLLECQLETGRTHQIRVHMASIGHPLVGDPIYGIKRDRQKGEGQLLHAALLGFEHPRTGQQMSFTAELPARIKDYIDKLK